jgi:8-oxo-dGTP diphosphatase
MPFCLVFPSFYSKINLMNNVNDRKYGEVLMVLRDRDIFLDVPDITGVVWEDRTTGKVVLFNKEDKIALIGNKVNEFFLLPGGGIESSEAIKDGIKRECREETGCEIEIQSPLGMTEDFRARDSKHYISYGYSANVISYGVPTLTESESGIGVYVKWLSLSEAIELFTLQEEKVKVGEVRFYNTCFNILRDSLFIRCAQHLIRKYSSS